MTLAAATWHNTLIHCFEEGTFPASPFSARGQKPEVARARSEPILSAHRHLLASPSPLPSTFASPTSNPSHLLYKTELCRKILENNYCPYGELCRFAHTAEELIPRINLNPHYKTRPCFDFHNKGFCTYGHRCNFIHNPSITAREPENLAFLSTFLSFYLPTEELPPLPTFARLRAGIIPQKPN